MRQLILQAADDPDRIVSWDTRLMTIGSARENDLVIEGAEIAPFHLILRELEDSGTILLFDLGSSEGTFVNGVKVSGTWSLSPGETVSLGRLQFAVQVDELAERGTHPVVEGSPAAQVNQGAVPPDNRTEKIDQGWHLCLEKLREQEEQLRLQSEKPLAGVAAKQADELAQRRRLIERVWEEGRDRELLLALKIVGFHDLLEASLPGDNAGKPVIGQLESILKEHSLRSFRVPVGAPWQSELDDLVEFEDLPHTGMVVGKTIRTGWFFDDGRSSFLLRPARVELNDA